MIISNDKKINLIAYGFENMPRQASWDKKCYVTTIWIKGVFWLKYHWKLFSGVQVNNKHAFVRIMTWRRIGPIPLS